MHDVAANGVEGSSGSFITRMRRKLRQLMSSDAEQAWEALRAEGQNSDEDALTEHERSLIQAALQLDTVTVDEISVPRSEVISLAVTASFAETVGVFQDSRKSRLPVIAENLDHVLGFISLKEVMAHVGHETGFDVKSVMRPATFLPEAMTLDKALQQLKKNHMQIAIVVDEYGGTAGLVTLKNMLEELVGDIEDEDEEHEPTAPEPAGPNVYRLDPRWSMADLRAQFHWPTPADDDEDFETVGGYVLALAGRIPHPGEDVVGAHGVMFKVSAANGRKILALEMTLPDAA